MADDDNTRAEFHLPGVEALRREEMWEMVHNDDFETALVTGCAGSGKTTLSIYRLIRLNNQGERVKLLTFQNMLVAFIKNCVVNNRSKLADIEDESINEERIATFHSWFYRLHNFTFDVNSPPPIEEIHRMFRQKKFKQNTAVELLIDEGQDLPLWIYEVLPAYYTRFLVSADENQQLMHFPQGHVDKIEHILSKASRHFWALPLGQNFRNTYETYCFARQFLPCVEFPKVWDKNIVDRIKSKKRSGRKPMVIPYSDIKTRNEHMQKILNNSVGIVGILCPIGPSSKEYNSGESAEAMYRLMTPWLPFGEKSATLYYSKNSNNDSESPPVPKVLRRYIFTTYMSAKGLEFDTVIIPRINFFRQPEKDKNTRIRQELYVACTRARSRIFIYRDLKNPQYDPISKSDFDPTTYESPGEITQGITD